MNLIDVLREELAKEYGTLENDDERYGFELAVNGIFDTDFVNDLVEKSKQTPKAEKDEIKRFTERFKERRNEVPETKSTPKKSVPKKDDRYEDKGGSPKVVEVVSTTNKNLKYNVEVHYDAAKDSWVGKKCQCIGFSAYGRCKHLRMAEERVEKGEA